MPSWCIVDDRKDTWEPDNEMQKNKELMDEFRERYVRAEPRRRDSPRNKIGYRRMRRSSPPSIHTSHTKAIKTGPHGRMRRYLPLHRLTHCSAMTIRCVSFRRRVSMCGA